MAPDAWVWRGVGGVGAWAGQPSRLPSPDQVIGFVTTGGHSTTRGCGYAVAVCSFRGLWALGAFQRRDLALPTVLVRNTTDLVLSPARLRILHA